MNELNLYWVLLTTLFVTAPIVFIYLLYFSAPYGRYQHTGWGPCISARLGWIFMEMPAILAFLYFFIYSTGPQTVAYLFLAMWGLHYLNRTFIFPLRLKNAKPMPIAVMFMGMCFNMMNTFVNAYALTVINHYDLSWLSDPRFIIGFCVFLTGFIINQYSDWILLQLRREKAGYQIPHGGLFSWVSCPNYLGEIIEWTGWAIATWSLAGLAFALWTIANLMPRALTHHRWYLQQFIDYPKNRRALIFWLI